MDYKRCSVEDLADYVEISSHQRITQQMMYYRGKGNFEMVEKIKEARKIAKKRKLVKMLEEMQ
jgi:hypothetical protein